MKFIKMKFLKVFEAVFVSILTALCGFILILFSNDCYLEKKINTYRIYFPIQLNCNDGEFSVMGSLFLNSPEKIVINLFHLNADVYSPSTLIIYFVVYFFLSVITYGLSVSLGLFIPSLLIGSVFGRLMALFFFNYINALSSSELNINEFTSKFALIGAASVLGGIVRMTISLTVILIEATGNISLGLPLMICLMLAKWVGDIFNEDLYSIHISLANIPFLHYDSYFRNHQLANHEFINVIKLMSTPVVTLRKIESVGTIIEILSNVSHSGFPIVDYIDKKNTNNHKYEIDNNEDDDYDEEDLTYLVENATNKLIKPSSSYLNQIEINKNCGNYGKLRGFILRWQLIVMLDNKLYGDNLKGLNLDIFRDAYPRYKTIDAVIRNIPHEDFNKKLDLSYVMNPSPYTVDYNCSFNRTYRLFRALGLRHLCVINNENDIVGIITRKDISQFRVIKYQNKRYLQRYSETICKKFNI